MANRYVFDSTRSASISVVFSEPCTRLKSIGRSGARLGLDVGNHELLENDQKVVSFSDIRKVELSDKDETLLRIYTRYAPLEYSFRSKSRRGVFVEKLRSVVTSLPKRLVSPHDLESPPLLEKIKIYVGSWNMGNAPPPDSYDGWIPRLGYEIYVFGGQEAGYDPRAGYSSCEDDWIGSFQKHLGSNFVVVGKASLWEIRIAVFVRKDCVNKITNIETGTEATGLAHVLGNKGGAAVKLFYNNTSLCFVGSHLAARKERLDNRRSNYMEIVDGLKFGNVEFDILSQFHHVFWFGDLNYRIIYPFHEAIAQIEAGNLEALQEHDQLKSELAKERVFYGFNEAGPLKFTPTYRFERGSREWSNKKEQPPSYTDRIMVMSLPGVEVRTIDYDASHNITTSDHSPLFGKFEVPVEMPVVSIDDPGMCRIKITNLKGRNLNAADVTGLSDPYVKFSSELFDGEAQTTIEKKTLNPQWSNNCVPQFIARAPCRDFVDNQRIYCRVFDWDLASADDLIGLGVISLRNAVADMPIPFTVALERSGVSAGKLQGMIHVEWVEEPTSVMENPYRKCPPPEARIVEEAVNVK